MFTEETGIPVSEDAARNRLRRIRSAPVGEAVVTVPDTEQQLRRSLDTTLRQLSKAHAKKAELVDAVYRAAYDASSALDLDPVPFTYTRPSPGRPETAVAVLSDWQLAKVTPTYSSAVCAERVELYGDKVIRLAGIQRADHPVKNLHVWLLGDLIEGELIFPGQSHLIDASLYRQVVVDGPRILAGFLRKMLAHFESVHVTAVIGNHGRIGGRASRDYDPESNADRMLYRITQMVLENETRLTWEIPDGGRERNWYAIDRIGNYSCLLFHGDQIKGGFAGFPFYGLGKKVWGWSAGAIKEPFKDVALGHWHQPTRLTLNYTTARVNGSTESDNTYAQEELAAAGRPAQWLLFVEPDDGEVTAEYNVRLDVD